MLFQETDTPGVYRDERGEMWPLGPDTVTKLRNSGSTVLPSSGSGGGDGAPAATVGLGSPWTPGPAPAAPPPVKRDFQAVPQQGGQDWQFSAQPKAPQGVQSLEGPSMLSRVGKPAQEQSTAGGPANLQRVLPRGAGQQQPSQDQRFYKRVGATPEKWVPTQRQTSGWAPEEQEDMKTRVTEERDALYNAKMAEIGAFEANQMDRKMRAERSYVENANKMMDEQRKLDTQNLYIEAQQKKIGERIKAARERKVDPTQAFQSVQGGLGGALAVLGMSLGAYSSGINGGPNVSSQLFSNMIERNVNEQLRLIEEEKEGAIMDKDELNSFQFKNNEEKKAYIRSIELAKQAADLDSITADESLRAIHPMALKAKAEVDERMNQQLMTVNSAISRTAGERYQPAQAGGVVDVTGQVLAQQAKESGLRKTIRENEDALTGNTMGETAIVAPGGEVVGKAPNAARAEKLNERQAAFAEAERLGTQMLEISKQQQETGSMFRSEEDKARYRSLATRYKNALWSAVRSDAPSSTESEAFEEAMGGLDLANFRAGRQSAVLQQTLEDGRNNLADRLQQQGGDPSYLRRRKPNATNEGYTP